MFTEDEIERIIKKRIEADEMLGDQSGESGHVGYVSYKINDVKMVQLNDEKIKIEYRYTTFVETEFTIYPDNPPMEYPKLKVIIVDKNKKIISSET